MAETNTYGNLTSEQAEFYSRTLLDRLNGQLQITKYAQKGLGAPKNAGDKVSYRRFNSLAVNTTELTEGVTPTALQASIAKVEGQVKQFGDYLVVTDKLQTVGLDPVITELSEVLGEQAGEKIETITMNTLTSGTNVVYAGGRVSRDTIEAGDVLTADMILKVATQLKDAKAKPITLPDGTKGYIMFAHTKQAYDLKKDPKWIEANHNHKDASAIINGCIGKYMGVYVVEYDFAPVLEDAGASDTDVFQAIVLSEGAFGMPDIEGSAKPEFILKVPKGDNSNTDDPLNQRSTIGWKNLFDVLILDELRLVRVETASSF